MEGYTEQVLTQQHPEQDPSILSPKLSAIRNKYFQQARLLNAMGVFETLFFTWISPLLTYGYRFALQQKAIPELKEEEKPEHDFERMKDAFLHASPSRIRGGKLLKSICKAFKKDIILMLVFAVLTASLSMYLPILNHDVIDYIGSKHRQLSQGLQYFFGVFVLKIVITLSKTFLTYYQSVFGFNLSNALGMVIYDKALRYPLLAQKQYTVSNIVNFSQVDAQRMLNLGINGISFVLAPFQIIIGFYLLNLYIGEVIWYGVAIVIILILISLVFARIASLANEKLLKAKDQRIKVTQQIIRVIKFIKVNTLEKSFYHKVDESRSEELRLTRKVNMCSVAIIFMFLFCPTLLVSTFFFVIVKMGKELTIAQAFLAIMIVNIIKTPIRQLPSSLNNLILTWSSFKRIQKFFDAQEIKNDYLIKQQKKKSQISVQIKDGYFLWSKTQTNNRQRIKIQNREGQSLPENQSIRQSLLSERRSDLEVKYETKFKALKAINVQIPAAKLTMIVGDVGSGKSSLLQAILNQMTPDDNYAPQVIVRGSLAYCAQKPWIFSGTLKQNILLQETEDEERLQKAIKYSCLEQDLQALPKGLESVIGEKGTTLSGGQKARVSLARAIYSNKDIYLLDDILSCVDGQVGKFIMEQTIHKFWRGKTVIMVTHSVSYLHEADNIIVMEKGQIIESGKLNELKQCPSFQNIVKVQSRDKREKPEIEMGDMIKNQEVQNEQQSPNETEKLIEQLNMPQDRQRGKVSKKVYLEYIKENGGAFFVIIVIAFMSGWVVLTIFSNFQIQTWCLEEDKTDHYLYLYLIYGITASAFSGLRAIVLILSTIRVGRVVHRIIMRCLLYTSIAKFYSRIPLGRLLNRLSKDLRQVDQTIGFMIGNVLVYFFTLVQSLSISVYASSYWQLIPIAIVSFICILLKNYYLKSQRQCIRLENITISPIISGFASMINGVETIRAFQKNDSFLKAQIHRVDINKRLKITRQALESWFAQRLSLFAFLVNITALAFCLLGGSDKASLAGLILAYSMSMNQELISLIEGYAELETKMISFQRINAFTKIEPELSYEDYCKKWQQQQQGSDLNAIKKGTIVFNNFSTRYRDGLDLVLKDISFSIKAGEKIGIVGRTGAGKSTLFNSILRLLEPANGQITIDQKNINQYEIKDLRSCITTIQQEPTLISGTIRKNFDPIQKYSDKKLKKICKMCKLQNLVQQKGGFDSEIDSQMISAGERQLFCFVRAFLNNTQIILIDQANANIDPKHEFLINQLILSELKGKTVLMIAHRLKALKNFDKIMVLGKGRVLQWGSPQKLLQDPESLYRKMWDDSDSSYLN